MDKVNVYIVKESLTLLEGEDLDMFRNAICESLMDQKYRKANGYDVYPTKITGSIVIVSEWDWDTISSDYVQYSYTRSSDGTFAFGDGSKVQMVCTFVPKTD